MESFSLPAVTRLLTHPSRVIGQRDCVPVHVSG